MRRPQPPVMTETTSQVRRIREAIIELIKWFDAGTRTTDLPTETLSDDDYLEFVKPNGTRYKATVGELRAHLGL